MKRNRFYAAALIGAAVLIAAGVFTVKEDLEVTRSFIREYPACENFTLQNAGVWQQWYLLQEENLPKKPGRVSGKAERYLDAYTKDIEILLPRGEIYTVNPEDVLLLARVKRSVAATLEKTFVVERIVKDAVGDGFAVITFDSVEGPVDVADYVYAFTADIPACEKMLDTYTKKIFNRQLGAKAKNKADPPEKPQLTLKANFDMQVYVEVSLKSQTVYVIKDGKVIIKSPVVTGSNKHPTDPGIFRIAYKDKNATLRGFNDDGTKYESKVRYWMPFNGGQGLHDASWRYEFGGNIHSWNGSHGCVNLPEDVAGEIYEKVGKGTVVIVY